MKSSVNIDRLLNLRRKERIWSLRIFDWFSRISGTQTWIYTLGLSIVVNILLFGLFFIFLNPSFETNDDVRMMLNASGAIDGSPSEFLLYTNVLIGLILKFFYVHFSGVNWYSMFLFKVHYISMVVILYSLLRLNFSWTGVGRYVFLFIFFEYPFLMFLQFTSTAFVAAIGGVCLLSASFRMKIIEGWISVVLSALLLIAAGLIRHEVYFGVCVLAGPFLLVKFWKTGTSRILLFVCSSLLIVCASMVFDSYYYSTDPQWKEYSGFNAVRGQLNGYPKLVYNEQTQDAYTRVGWNRNDFLMFKNKFFYDRDIFSTEKLTSINNALRNKRTPGEMAGVLSQAIVTNRIILCAGALFLVLSILSIARNERKFIVITVAMAAGICIVLAYSARLPFHVFIPIAFFVNVINAVLLSYSPAENAVEIPRYRTVAQAAIIVLLVLLLSVQIFVLHRWSDANRTSSLVLTKKIRYLSSWKNALVFVCGKNSLDIRYTPPFSDLQEYRNVNVLFSGWSINSPLSEKLMAKYGIDDRSVYLGGNGTSLFIMGNETSHQNTIETFVREHYRHNIRFVPVGRCDDMSMYTIVKSDIPNE